MEDKEYIQALLAKFDAASDSFKRQLFAQALTRIDFAAGRHYEVIDAYEVLMQEQERES